MSDARNCYVGGMIEADQVEAVHNAAKPPSKVKQVLGKITHHKAKGPYEAGAFVACMPHLLCTPFMLQSCSAIVRIITFALCCIAPIRIDEQSSMLLCCELQVSWPHAVVPSHDTPAVAQFKLDLELSRP